MLTRLGSYLFGGEATDDAAVDGTQANQQVQLDTKEGDMGWLLVDTVPGEAKQQDEAVGEERRPRRGRVTGAETPCKSWCLGTDPASAPCPVQDTDKSDTPSQPELRLRDCALRTWYASHCEGSWIMPATPVFTRPNRNTPLGSSVKENCLLEDVRLRTAFEMFCPELCQEEFEVLYPSFKGWREDNSIRLEAEQDTSETDLMRRQVHEFYEEWARQQREDEEERRRLETPRRRVVVAAAADLNQLERADRWAKRNQQVATGRPLSRRNMQRSNMVASIRKSNSARNRALRPSGCKNSRYGQRTQ